VCVRLCVYVCVCVCVLLFFIGVSDFSWREAICSFFFTFSFQELAIGVSDLPWR